MHRTSLKKWLPLWKSWMTGSQVSQFFVLSEFTAHASRREQAPPTPLLQGKAGTWPERA